MSYRDSEQAALNEKLQDLKGAMQDAAAPERVEAALVAAFREHAHGAPRPRPMAWPRWALAAGVAAALLLAVTAGLFRDQPAPAPATRIRRHRTRTGAADSGGGAEARAGPAEAGGAPGSPAPPPIPPKSRRISFP